MVKKDALLVYLQRRLFLLFYRATALQRGKSFPSCAWRMPLLHRGFSLTFTRRFLGLTTFLRQNLGAFSVSPIGFSLYSVQKKVLIGISQKVLTDSLRLMEEAGICPIPPQILSGPICTRASNPTKGRPES